MTKIDARTVLRKAIEKNPVRGNVTFRIDAQITQKFKKTCERQGASASAVIEEFMNQFIEEFKR